jgi:hypothetical protein
MSVFYSEKRARNRKSMSGIINFIRKRRDQVKKATIYNTREAFIDMDNINRGDFALSKEKLEFFYPSSKNQVNWGYEKDHMAIAAKADKKYLRENFPVKRPDFETYFEEREKIALQDSSFPLRFPAIFYLSKHIHYKCIIYQKILRDKKF